MAGRRIRSGIVRWLSGLLASVLLVAVVSGLTVLFQRWLLPLRVLYILAVVPVAIFWGIGLAALTLSFHRRLGRRGAPDVKSAPELGQ